MPQATFPLSNDGVWPWIFDECVDPSDTAACAANTCGAQKITACDPTPGFGLNPYQGRGAPEIDVVEVQTGTYVNEYTGGVKPWMDQGITCPLADTATAAAAFMRQPFVSTSLMAAPGIPQGSAKRPSKGCVPLTSQWYPEIDPITLAAQSSAYKVGINYDFYGDLFSDYFGGGMHSDAFSVNTALDEVHFSGFHTYRVEWRAGNGGYMRWSIDGQLQFQLEETIVSTPRSKHKHHRNTTHP